MSGTPYRLMLFRILPIVLAVACVTALLMLYEHMHAPVAAPPRTHALRVVIPEDGPLANMIEIEAVQGDLLRLSAHSKNPTVIQLHGYQKSWDLKPGKPIRQDILLTHTGRFALEQIDNATPIAMITVLP